MKRLLPFFTALVIILSSCSKHTEIISESIDLTDSYWKAYEINNKELSKEDQFMFYFTKSQDLKILFLNVNNNKYEPKYTFYYSDFKGNSAIYDGYFLSSPDYKEAIIHYTKLDSNAKKMEFKLRLFPDSDYIIIKMNRLEKVSN